MLPERMDTDGQLDKLCKVRKEKSKVLYLSFCTEGMLLDHVGPVHHKSKANLFPSAPGLRFPCLTHCTPAPGWHVGIPCTPSTTYT